MPGLARAWAKFKWNSTQKTMVFAASYNVQSVTRNAAGDYTIQFIQPFTSQHFVWTGMVTQPASGGVWVVLESSNDANNTNTKRILVNHVNTGNADSDWIYFVAWGEQ
jgi:hypothetical protein